MQGKQFAWVPWVAFLVSAVAEWGFDVDFPLTPLAWLALAILALFAATLQAEARQPCQSRSILREIGAGQPADDVMVSGLAVSFGLGSVRCHRNDSSPNALLSALGWPHGFEIAMISKPGIAGEDSSLVETVSSKSETERGPPREWNRSRVFWTPDRGCRPGLFVLPIFLPFASQPVCHQPGAELFGSTGLIAGRTSECYPVVMRESRA